MQASMMMMMRLPSGTAVRTACLALLCGSVMGESRRKAVIQIQGHDILTAAANGDIERVRDHLIANPALVHVTDDSDGETGRTALIWSSIFGHMEVCKLLVECKADVMARDNENTTALHLTSCKGHMEVCKFLVECKADVNATDDSGGTPLICACSQLGPLPRGGEGHLEVCKFLVECKADVMARTKGDGAGVIEWSRDRFGHHKIAAYLLSVGAMEPYELYKHLGSVSGSSVSGSVSGSGSESESGSASASSLGSESESESESGSEESASGSSKSSGSNDAPKKKQKT